MSEWKPENWAKLDRPQRRAARRSHRREVLGRILNQARSWILEAAHRVFTTGDERHAWVVDGLVLFVEEMVPFWLRPLVRSKWFRRLLDGVVFDLYESMKREGARL